MKNEILAVIGLVVLLIFLIAIQPWAIMILWNWLMTDSFGVKGINYWQAFGFLILCQLLFNSTINWRK